MEHGDNHQQCLSQKLLKELWYMISTQQDQIEQLKQKIKDLRYGCLLNENTTFN